MSLRAAHNVAAVLSAVMLCAAACGKPFTPAGVSNRTKDRISLARTPEALCIKVKEYHEWDGQAVLPEFKLAAGTEYEFSCNVAAPAIKCFYIQAFLIKGRQKLRIESEENDSENGRVVLRFNSLDFEKIEIALRNRCLEDCVGRSFRVTDFYFGIPQKTVPESKPRLEIVPQFNSAGIYLNNNRAAAPDKFKAQLFFRESGSKDFHPALPVTYNCAEKVMRASLVKLKEDTAYDLRIDIEDSGRKETLTGSFRTRSSNFPIAQTIVLKDIPAEFKSGTPSGYIRYISAPGVVLDGKEHNRAAINLENQKYIIIDSLEIKGGRIEGINLKNAENIVIRNCNIHGFGRVGIHRPDIDGRYYEKSYSLNNDCGIRLFNSSRITVENCVIHSPRGNANSWFYTHPSGPNGIHIGDSKEIVLRGNDIFGSTFHRWNDAVESKGNGKISGGIGRDAEVYGNYFAAANDDGMELDGGQMNVRFAYNKSEDTLCGVSAAPCLAGPSYIMNNLFCGRGDAYFYKASGIKNNYSCSGTGTLFFISNTILDFYDGIGGFSIRADEKNLFRNPVFKVYGRNNLVRTAGPLYSRGVFKKEFVCDVAGDRMCTGSCFVNESNGNYRLKCPSEAGAVQGKVEQLPLRFTDFELDTAKLTFECPDGKPCTKYVQVSAMGDSKLKVVQGSDFFKITPAEFELKAGEKKKLEVTVIPEKMQLPARFVSAFSVRQQNGASRPVLVECFTWDNAELLKKMRAGAVYGKITPLSKESFKAEFTVEKAGNYYLFLRHRNLPKLCYSTVSFDGKRGEKKMIRPPSGFQNAWCIISAPTYNGKPNRPLKLVPGKHTIVVNGIDSGEITGFAAASDPDMFRLAPGK